MTKPILHIINGGALGTAEIDAAVAAIEFAPIFERSDAEKFAGRAEHGALCAAEQVTAAVAILAKDKTELATLIAAAGADQVAEAHLAIRRALAGANMLCAILRAAEARFAIARAAASLASDNWAL
jgi:hypothetical protein